MCGPIFKQQQNLFVLDHTDQENSVSLLYLDLIHVLDKKKTLKLL